MTSDLAPPTPTDRPPRPGSIGIAVSFWTASVLVALMAFVAAYTDRATVRDRLAAAAMAEDPTIAADVLRDGVSLTMVAVLVGNGLLLLLAGLCLVLVLRGRRAARGILIVLGLLILLAIAFDQSFVTGGVEADRILLWTEAGLVLVATVALLTRSSGEWIRAARR